MYLNVAGDICIGGALPVPYYGVNLFVSNRFPWSWGGEGVDDLRFTQS
jgi:hypothetical protein